VIYLLFAGGFRVSCHLQTRSKFQRRRVRKMHRPIHIRLISFPFTTSMSQLISTFPLVSATALQYYFIILLPWS